VFYLGIKKLSITTEKNEITRPGESTPTITRQNNPKGTTNRKRLQEQSKKD
jgi:hypothetical protein